MEEDTRNRVIVDAKRGAKARSRASGESYQRSLEHIARSRGREDWNAFLSDPVDRAPDLPRWAVRFERWCDRHPARAVGGAVSLILVSVAVLVALAAEHGVGSPLHVPTALWLPLLAFWAALGTWLVGRNLRALLRSVLDPDADMVDADGARTLINILVFAVACHIVHIGLYEGVGWGLLLSASAVLCLAWAFPISLLLRSVRRQRDRTCGK